ncbi:MAG: AAA family ATPase [Pseudomonadota bacterium]
MVPGTAYRNLEPDVMPNFVSIEDAVCLLRTAKRISVVGVSGAGKSTLSRRLAASLNLRSVSLDRDMRWMPGWTVRDKDEQRDLHDAFVAGDRWVIDGTNISFMDTRLPRSDFLIWLRLPRSAALAGIAKRVTIGYGRVRPDMAAGCPEKLPGLEFLSWIWKFESRQSPRLISTIDTFAPDLPILVLRSRADRDRFTKLIDVAR